MHGGRVAAEHSTRVRRAACLAAACAGLAALVLLRRAEDVSPALPRPCAGDSACAAPPLPCPLPYTSDTRVAQHLQKHQRPCRLHHQSPLAYLSAQYLRLKYQLDLVKLIL